MKIGFNCPWCGSMHEMKTEQQLRKEDAAVLVRSFPWWQRLVVRCFKGTFHAIINSVLDHGTARLLIVDKSTVHQLSQIGSRIVTESSR